MNAQICELQDDLEQRIQRHEECQEEIKSLRTAQSRLQEAFEKSQDDTSARARKQCALQDEIADLEQRLDLAANVARQLEEASRSLEEVTDELNSMKKQQPSLERLEKESSSRQQELEAKYHEIQTLRKEVEKQHARSTQLEEQAGEKDRLLKENASITKQVEELREEVSVMAGLQQQLQQRNSRIFDLESTLAASQLQLQGENKLAEENISIQKQVEELRKEVSTMSDLQKRLQHQNVKIATLESRLAAAHKEAQRMHELAEENGDMRKSLKELQNEAAKSAELQMELHHKKIQVAGLETTVTAAQSEAVRVAGLQETNSSLMKTIVSLSTDIEQLNRDCAQIPPLVASITTKDDRLAELQKELASSNAQTEELEMVKLELRAKLEGLATQQQQILNLEAALTNARLDQEGNLAQQQRRVADWSDSANVSANPHIQHSHSDTGLDGDHPSQTPGSSVPPTGNITVVPDTQLEVPETLPVESHSFVRVSGGQQQDDIESDLSPVPSEDEDDHIEDEVEASGTRGTQGFAHRQEPRVPLKTNLPIQSSQELPERPPSSSYESHSDQMLLDQVSQRDSQEAHAYSSGAVAPSFVMPWNRIKSGKAPSPRRLRSDSQSQPYTAATAPESHNLRGRASTPAVMRERHQPNSAAKRSMEPEADENVSKVNPKKLKRKPTNLEVKKPQLPAPKQGADQKPPQGTTSYRKSSSIVGTNAPAPGKSQRISKAVRKGSRQDRYAARFAVDV